MTRLVWPILIIAAIILGLVVSAAGTETRVQIEYLTRLHDHATEMSKNAAALTDLVGRLRTISRAEFLTVVEAIEEDLATAGALVDEEPPTPSVMPVRAMFRQAVGSWERGVSGLSEALLHAADNPGDNRALDLVAAALAELRAGDAIYAQLLLDTEREDIPSPLTPLPPVVMSPSGAVILTLSLLYVDAARSPQNTLGLLPGLAVSQIIADPPWQVDATGQVVVTTTEEILFSVVMTNAGNVGSSSQELTLVMEGGSDPVELSQLVEPLRPGHQVTLVFEPIAVLPGLVYVVTASIESVPEDANLDDNVRRVQFLVGEG